MELNAPIYGARDTDDAVDDLDFIFNRYYRARRWQTQPAEVAWRPLTDMFETEDEIIIVMDIAGITLNDIKLSIIGNILSIRGVRREQTGRLKRHFHKMEIDFGPFERSVKLPSPVNPNRTSVRYLHGFLEIHLPKQEEQRTDRFVIPIS